MESHFPRKLKEKLTKSSSPNFTSQGIIKNKKNRRLKQKKILAKYQEKSPYPSPSIHIDSSDKSTHCNMHIKIGTSKSSSIYTIFILNKYDLLKHVVIFFYYMHFNQIHHFLLLKMSVNSFSSMNINSKRIIKTNYENG